MTTRIPSVEPTVQPGQTLSFVISEKDYGNVFNPSESSIEIELNVNDYPDLANSAGVMCGLIKGCHKNPDPINNDRPFDTNYINAPTSAIFREVKLETVNQGILHVERDQHIKQCLMYGRSTPARS